MIEKIIANGLSNAAIAALDVAIRLGLDYGGWCTQKAVMGDRYQLEWLPDASESTLLQMAIDAADGSLYVVYGQHTVSDVEKNKKAVLKRNKPFLSLDLAQESGFAASRRVAGWLAENRIRVLHVDGTQDDPRRAITHDSVAGILEATFFLSMMETGVTSPLQSMVRSARFPEPVDSPPQSMAAAIDHLEQSLSLKDKTTIANMVPEELISLHFTIGEYINNQFALFTTNTQLLDDCRRQVDRKTLAPRDAAAIIIRRLWQRLRDHYRIRIVK